MVQHFVGFLPVSYREQSFVQILIEIAAMLSDLGVIEIQT